MASYRVCDICGVTMPKDEKKHCFVHIEASKTYRQINPDYDGLPYVNIECCPICARTISCEIKKLTSAHQQIKPKTYESAYEPTVKR